MPRRPLFCVGPWLPTRAHVLMSKCVSPGTATATECWLITMKHYSQLWVAEATEVQRGPDSAIEVCVPFRIFPLHQVLTRVHDAMLATTDTATPDLEVD
eukprot:2380672-Alexandrium_andersonii.AAC.1